MSRLFNQPQAYLAFLLILAALFITSCASTDDTGTITLSNSGEETTQQANESTNLDPGESSGNLPEDGSAEVIPEPSFDTATWLTYTNEAYSFSVNYPAYFEILNTIADNLAPKPLGLIRFMDTRIELKDISPPVFAVHVYPNQNQLEIKAWLNSNGYRENQEWKFTAFKNEHFSGMKVSSTNYASPGEFIFVLHKDWVIMLTPAGEEANAMLGSFQFKP